MSSRMLRMTSVLLLFVVSCAPTYRITTKRCPRLAPFATDFALVAVGLASAAGAYNEGRQGLALGISAVAMSVALSSNVSECRQ